MKRALALAVAWLGLAAATPLPLTPPPPDLAPLVSFVAAPLDKPPVVADAKLPPPPVELPPLPLATLTLPAADKPVAPPPSPRALPCIGAWLGMASESLECGRARFLRGEFDEAVRALESAARPGADRETLNEARYWLGETYYRLRRFEQADWLFRQVAQDMPRQDWGVWALHGSGWTALRVGDTQRAREAFTALLARPVPAPLDVWGRFGLGLANYALGRHEEAAQAFGVVLQRGAPTGLARDLAFWHGEALGRSGNAASAVAELRRFVDGSTHPLLATARLRLAWWTLAAGRGFDAVASFRSALAGAPSAERDWGEVGLALALLGRNDWTGARDTAAALSGRRSPLALPLLLRLTQAALDSPTTADIASIVQALLGADLTPPVRGWVLLVKGEVDRAQGNRDEARTQFELARTVARDTPLASQASFRLARINFELREFNQALTDVPKLASSAPLPADLRAAILILQGEAAYQAGDHAAAGAAYRRVLLEFPDAKDTPMVRLAAAWTSLRQGRAEPARREFFEFARMAPSNPHAVDALVLSAELAMAAGDTDGARQLLDWIVRTYPIHPMTDFARLNRGILLVRTGDAVGAQTELRDWLGRAPFPALFGRAHAALGAAMLGTGDLAGAQREFALAKRDGLDAFANLGFGTLAMGRARWDEAARAFTEGRDAGTPDIVAGAEYGLAAVQFAKSGGRDFKKSAQATLAALPPGPRSSGRAGALLYVLAGIAVDEKDWPGALGFARRLADEYPNHEAADDALERIAAGAAAVPAWPVALQADTLLRQRYPQSPFVAAGRLRVAEALLETGKADEARREAEQGAAAAANDPRAALLLARVREAAGDRGGAIEAYARAARDRQAPQLSTPALLSQARLLVEERRWDQARGVFERLLKSDDVELVAQAARGIGDAYAGEGDPVAAAEYYLTAAYVAPTSPHGRRALLSAGQAFAVAKHTEAAALAYRKLLAQSDLPADLAAAARQGLSALGR